MNKMIYCLVLLVLASCSTKDVLRPEWPEWPTVSKPKIENAVLRGINGATTVHAGDVVQFSADVSDENNDLVSCQLLITMNDAEILNISEALQGRSAKIEKKITLPFVAGFENGTLTVKLRVSNALAKTTTELTLDPAASVAVIRPETPDKLYLIDNNGKSFELIKSQGAAFGFQTGASDLAGIGTHFRIAEKLVNNAPDYSALVWGYSNGKISVVNDASSELIPVPSVGNYTIETISFDMLDFKVEPTLTLTIDVNTADFFSIGGDYTQLDKELVPYAKINFTGMGTDVINVLRPEFFKKLSGTKAKFMGPAALYNLKYNLNNKCLYLERPRDVFYPEVMYIVGTGAGFPRQPYTATLAWDFSFPHQWFLFRKTGASTFEAILYLDNTMGFKFYRGYGWAQEEDTKNKYRLESDNYITKNDAGDIIPGPDFKPGVFRISIDKGSEVITAVPVN